MTRWEHIEEYRKTRFERIGEYRKRMENCVDLFTGKPLAGDDLEGWKVVMQHRQQYENSPAAKLRLRANV